MATTVSQLVSQSDGYMKFINYHETYADNNKEFLRGDMWEFKFINPPKIVYYPGDSIINARLNNVNVSIDSSVNGFDKRMRGNYTIHQATGQNTACQLALSFVDREDQAISYFVTDWRNRVADPECKYSFRKADLVADCKLTITNSSRLEVRTLNFYNCSMLDAPLDENGVEVDGSDRADIQLQLFCEHYDRTFDNL